MTLNQNMKRAAGAAMLALALIGCAGTAASTATATPTATDAGQGGAIPSTTPTFVLPPPTGGGGDVIVGGPVEAGDAVTGLPVRPTEGAAGSPAPPVVDSNGQVNLTLNDHGKTITLKTGQTFLLKLDLAYYWTIDFGSDGVLFQVMTFAPIPDAQGMFSATKPGRVKFTAVGDLACRTETPPCMAPSRLFEVTIVVE